MKIKLTKIISLVIILTFLTGCTNNTNRSEVPICKVDSCDNKCVKVVQNSSVYGDYCKDHTCKEDGCTNLKNDDGYYCSFHTEQQIQLSDSQIEEVREMTNKYFEELMSKQPNILAINLIGDNPKTTTNSISFRCNIVREDSDTNLATLYIYITGDGVFKIDKLEYDK